MLLDGHRIDAADVAAGLDAAIALAAEASRIAAADQGASEPNIR